ncbi:agmatinase [Sulfolobales archaeon HS-7]|nr:agmatinase [Sulfolobales archaeon HS-7]
MESALLYLNEDTLKFAGFEKKESKYAIVGAPLDVTSSYRPGTRFAPSSIRQAAQYIEFYSLRQGIDIGDIGFRDFGDIILHPSNIQESLKRIRNVIGYILSLGKFPITIGGEHTITQGIIDAFEQETCVVSFDAHLDLREDYLGDPFDHASVMRRISEKGVKIMEIGTRAVTREEVQYARNNGIDFVTSYEIRRLGIRDVAKRVREFENTCKNIYVSFDIDVLDPAYAPGAQTPEPDGLSTPELLDILQYIITEKVIGMDIVEISPIVDTSNITSILGSKIIMEAVAAIESSVRVSQNKIVK